MSHLTENRDVGGCERFVCLLQTDHAVRDDRDVARVPHVTGPAHAFMLDAIAQTVEEVERDDDFHRIADGRWAKVLATAKTVPWDGAKVYLEARSRGQRPHKPAARKFGR